MRIIYCDGACKGNPGPAGAAALLVAADGRSPELRRLKPLGLATNQVAELNALILALEIAASLDEPVTIFSDSKYSLDGATEWIHNWKNNGWRTAAKKPVANENLWRTIDAMISSMPTTPKLQWVRGHNGHHFNELADQYANEAVTAPVINPPASPPVKAVKTPAPINSADDERRAILKKKIAKIRASAKVTNRSIATFIVGEYIIDHDTSPEGSTDRLIDAIEIALNLAAS